MSSVLRKDAVIASQGSHPVQQVTSVELSKQAKQAWLEKNQDEAVRLMRAAIVARAIEKKKPYPAWEKLLLQYEKGEEVAKEEILLTSEFGLWVTLFEKLGIPLKNEMPVASTPMERVDYTFNYAAAVVRLGWNLYYNERKTKSQIVEKNEVPVDLQSTSTLLIKAATEKNRNRAQIFQNEATKIPTRNLELLRDAGCNGSKLAVNVIAFQRREGIFKGMGFVLAPLLHVQQVQMLRAHFNMLNSSANRYDWDVMRTIHSALKRAKVSVTLDYPNKDANGKWDLNDPDSYPGRYRMNRYLAGMETLGHDADVMKVGFEQLFGGVQSKLLTATETTQASQTEAAVAEEVFTDDESE